MVKESGFPKKKNVQKERQQLLTIMASTVNTIAKNRENGKSMGKQTVDQKSERKATGRPLGGKPGLTGQCCGHNDRKRKYIKHIDYRLTERECVYVHKRE